MFFQIPGSIAEFSVISTRRVADLPDVKGPCECDLVLSCSKFLTTSEYAPRLHTRLAVEKQLIQDATARGWQREIERHTATHHRIEQLLRDLDEPADQGLRTPQDPRTANPSVCP